MKRIFFQLPLLLLLAAVFLSCEDSVEKPAMELLEEARKARGVEDCYPFGESHHLVAGGEFTPDNFKKSLAEFDGLFIEPVKPTIEDMFIKLMKQ